ncbi:MAG: hypothetical protein RMM06_08795 [Armatimonadota bacterium]|nr:hypothetical protein [Armatimonadota bacterium]
MLERLVEKHQLSGTELPAHIIDTLDSVGAIAEDYRRWQPGEEVTIRL